MLKRLLGTAAFVGLACGLTVPAYAARRSPAPDQKAAAPIGAVPASDAAPADGVASKPGDGGIIITGSRISRADLTSPSPLTVVGGDLFRNSADTAVVRTLDKLPSVTPSAGPTSPSTFGQSFVSLRGLGPARVLILLNGRRYIPTISNGGVDVSSIAPELLQRVEIVTGGASATYGSDAIAGVVNFIYKKHFDGVEVDAQTGVTGRGEGVGSRLALTTGGSFGGNRGEFYINGSYEKVDAILTGDRAFQQFLYINQGGALVPFRVNIPTTARTTIGGLSIFNAGELYSSPGVVNPLGNNGFNQGPYSIMQQPSDKVQLNTGFSYKVTDRVEVYGEGTFLREHTAFEREPAAVTLPTILFPANSPFFGPLTRAAFAARADAQGMVTIPGLARRFAELGNVQDKVTRDSYRGMLGFTAALPGDWKADVYGLYQRSDFNRNYGNVINVPRLVQALTITVLPNGSVVCRDPSFGCAPANIFGTGTISPAAAAFVTSSPTLRGYNTEQVLTGYATGSLFRLPAGPVKASFGLEYRRDSAAEIPDTDLRLGLSSESRFLLLKGASKYYEGYGEILVPLLANLPLIRSLSFEGGLRYTRFAGAGDAWTYKALGEWTPVKGIRFRGGVQRAIRAPNVFERFGGDNVERILDVDPCFTGAPLSGRVREVCLATGVPLSVANNGGPRGPFIFRGLEGGSQTVQPEKSNSLTVGVVIENLIVPRLSFTADYYDIRLHGAIGRLGYVNIVNQCFSGSTGVDDECANIIRDPASGVVTSIINNFQNANSNRSTGIDFGAAYHLPVPSLAGGTGSLSLNVTATYKIKESSTPFAGTTIECAGYYGPSCPDVVPHWSSYTQIAYQTGPAVLNLNWRWVGSARDTIVYQNPAGIASLARTSIPNVHYFDASLRLKVYRRNEIFVSVDNIFDQDPTIIGRDRVGGGRWNVYPSQYDMVGRRFAIGGRFVF